MKKTLKGSPNQQLKTERELRGWSQKYVADQLGADHYYLSRWERGTATPSPYYRQKLCALFGKNARELGLLPEQVENSSTSSSIEAPVQKSEASPVFVPQSGPISDPAIPLFVAEDTGLVGRDDLLRRLKNRLCSGKGVVVTALSGLPGAGKTSLAASVASDPDILEHFSEGVLWTGLGPSPDVLSHLSRWGMLLGMPAAEATRLSSVEEWIKALRLAIGTRRLLLVIDDAWRIEAALAFKVGGPHCAYVMTTRFPPVALQFAPADAITVPELSEEEGMSLLSRFAPDVVTSEPQQVRQLVQDVGGLPLALTIMGKYLRKEAYSHQPRRVRAALQRLRDAQERLRLTAPHIVSEHNPSLSSDTAVSLQTVIEVGDRGLSEQARAALYALSVFPARPNSFTEEAAAAVAAAPVEVLDELTDAGLLESSEDGRYSMHQTIADYARQRLHDGRDSGAYGRFAVYMAAYVETHRKEYEVLEQESGNILTALQAASREGRHADFVYCMNAYTPFLLARGLFPLAGQHLSQAEQSARILQDAGALSTTLLYLGRVQHNRGDDDAAETTLQEALTLARQNISSTREGLEMLCRILDVLGIVARYQGHYRPAEAYHQEGLALARRLGDQELICSLLKDLGIDFGEQGQYAREEACYREGVTLARQVGDSERLCELLINLGQAVFAQGNYAQALDYSRQALQLCRDIGYRYAMTTLLADLGAMYVEQKDYAQAEMYLREGLENARQMEHRNLIGVNLVNLGELFKEQGKEEQAEACLQEALAIARQIKRQWLLCGVLHALGDLELRLHRFVQAAEHFRELSAIAGEENQEYRGVALYGLARAAQGQGDSVQARSLGQESLRILEAIGNRQLPEVKAWFEQLQY